MKAEKDWIYSTNIYEVNLRQYTKEGTFNAFKEHLPRLRSMGVETLWFMPLTPISQKVLKGTMGSYYACSDYTSINPEFGTLEDFKTLVTEAKKLGFRIILDWVANHTGWDHVWTVEHPEWYQLDQASGEFKRASGMDDIIELDFNNHDMRKAMIGAMKFWIMETGIDGFRCDLAFWVELDFWIQAKSELSKLKELFWLAEADSLDNPEYMQVFDASYTWTWMHKTEKFYQNQVNLSDLNEVLMAYERAPGLKAWFTTNHDENSWNGTEYEKYGAMAKPLAVFSCTWPGIPLLYSGQELPNTKRLKFFDKDCIPWTGRYELHDFYKKLLDLKSTSPALKANAEVFHVHTTNDLDILAFFRKEGQDELLVILNFSIRQVNFQFRDLWLTGKFRDIMDGTEFIITKQLIFDLPAWGYRILKVENLQNP